MRARRVLRAAFGVALLLGTLYAGLFAGWKPTYKEESASYPLVVFDQDLYVARDKGATERHAFDDAKSRTLSADRKLPDSRHPDCRKKSYKLSGQPKVSVVVSFFNEARSVLIRTITSLLNRSPADLLEEILLIDDFSDEAEDGSRLGVLPKVKVLRNDRREGLIRSRDRGARSARGDHLVFLDSHIEVNVGWLEPLLEVALQHPKSLVSPVIDVIDPDTFQYKNSSSHPRGGFDWGLRFKWLSPSPEERSRQRSDPSSPFKSPVVPGGLFLVRRDLYLELGGFDPGLEIWGAENLEMSFKAWLCLDDGGVLTVPCSRVGHVFRRRHPYVFPNGSSWTYLRNSKRVAEVWLDEYKTFFYEKRPAARDIDPGSLNDRRNLKNGLACKPFKWFLENVFKELRFPHRDSVAFGQLRQGEQCLEVLNGDLLTTSCLLSRPSQEWSYSVDGFLANGDNCISSKDGQVSLEACRRHKYQYWTRRRRRVVHRVSGLCLEASRQSNRVALAQCERYSFSQQWDFTVELQSLHPLR